MCLDVAHRILQITEIRVKQLHASSCYRLRNMCCGVVLYCVSIGCSAVRMWNHFLPHISTDWWIVYVYLCSMVEVSLEAYPLQTEGVSSLYIRNEWELGEIL